MGKRSGAELPPPNQPRYAGMAYCDECTTWDGNCLRQPVWTPTRDDRRAYCDRHLFDKFGYLRGRWAKR